MQMIGKRSLASTLKIILNIFYYVSIALEGLISLAIIIVLIAGEANIVKLMDKLGAGHLKMEVSGLSFNFTGNFPSVIFPKLILTILVIMFITFIIEILIVYQLRKIFDSLIAMNPFRPENVKRIRRIGILTIAGSLVYSLCEFIIFRYMSGFIRVNDLDIKISFSINWTVVFLGFVIMILAEVFRLGFELQEDKDLTI